MMVYCYSSGNPRELIFTIDACNNVKVYSASLEMRLATTGLNILILGNSIDDPLAAAAKANWEKTESQNHLPIEFFKRKFLKPPSPDAPEEEKAFFSQALCLWTEAHGGKYGRLEKGEYELGGGSSKEPRAY